MRLRRSGPAEPGYTRGRQGGGFQYRDASGRVLRDPAEKARVAALAIPPAWRKVWICARPNGHLQAVGLDAAGRRQYVYHPSFRAKREQAKHAHVLEVAEALPRLRQAIEADLGGRGLSRDRVLATAARLLDLGFFRVGSERYTDAHHTYGLTTLLREHASVGRDHVTFAYVAKHGKRQAHAVVDSATCQAVRALKRRRGGGRRLLAYWQGRRWHDVTGDELNAYLRERAGVEVSAKDFRTWHATVLAAVALAVSNEARGSEGARRRAIARATREVSHYLGNTPAVCRASYINPRVVELYERGVTIAPTLHRLGAHGEFGVPATQGAVEQAVREMLRAGRRPD